MLRVDARLLQDRSQFEAKVLSLCPRATQDKMSVILRYIAEKSKCPGYAVKVVPDDEYVFVYCKNGLEMRFLLSSLRERRRLDVDDLSDHLKVVLTADGWTKVEELEKPNMESSQAQG